MSEAETEVNHAENAENGASQSENGNEDEVKEAEIDKDKDVQAGEGKPMSKNQIRKARNREKWVNLPPIQSWFWKFGMISSG